LAGSVLIQVSSRFLRGARPSRRARQAFQSSLLFDAAQPLQLSRKMTFCDGHHSRRQAKAPEWSWTTPREMIMKRFATLAAVVSLCAFAATPLRAEEPASEPPAPSAPAAVPAIKGMPKLPAMMKDMPAMMRKMPEPMVKAMERIKPEDIKSMIGGLCPDCKFEMPAK